MTENVRPCDLHPALTEERLVVVARMLANARRDAVSQASPALGDDAWSVGCRAYAFTKNRLARVAENGIHPWLRVLDHTTAFTFLVDGVPVRFFRGPADEPTERTLRRQEAEAKQLALALGEAAAEDGLLFRLAVETGDRGGVERVVFLALRGEDRVECFWPVPLEPARPTDAASGPEPAQLPLLHADAPPKPRRGRRKAA